MSPPAMEPLEMEMEMERLHPSSPSSPSSTTTLPNAVRRNHYQDHILDRLWALVRLYMELHPIIATLTVFALLTLAMSIAVTVLFGPNGHYHHHGPERNRLHHDYSQIEYDFNFKASQLDHWCLFGDDSACLCEDFTDPVPRIETHGWIEAHERNRRLASRTVPVTSSSSSSGQYDLVVLGDDTVELWNGVWLNAPVAHPNGVSVQRIWNETFTLKGGGDLEGLALGIKGDSSSNLLWRLQHGEMPQSLKSKVWWIVLGGEDLARGGCSEEATVLGLLRVAEEIHYYHPNNVIVIQGILPRSSKSVHGVLTPPKSGSSAVLPSFLRRSSNAADHQQDYLWPSIERINQQLLQFCEHHPHMVYFDASKLFLGTVGNEYYRSTQIELIKELMSDDYIHPNVQGMQLLAERMSNEVKKIIYDQDESTDIEVR